MRFFLRIHTGLCARARPNPHARSPSCVRGRASDPGGAATSNGRYRGMRRRGWGQFRGLARVMSKPQKKQRNVVNITRPAMTTAVGGAGAEGGGYGTRRPSSQRRRCKVGARVTGPATPGHPPGPGQPHLCKNVLHVHRRTHGEEKGIHMYELACPLLLSSL